MSGRYLLDTNIVIALFKSDVVVASRLSTSTEIFVPVVVLGELYFGAEKSSQRDVNVVRVDEFASGSSVLGCDLETARRYGSVKDALRKKGRPLPENDIWIAAVAMRYGLTVVSRDAHFSEVEGLLLEVW
jgi:tRNA(fMet)-specific endonuclease VapC